MQQRSARQDAEKLRRVWWRLFTAFLSLLICCGAYWHTAFSDADVPFFSWAVPKESPVPVIEITVPLSESIP